MASLGKGRFLAIPFILLFTACNNIYLTAPFSLKGDVELFLDGKLAACANLDRSFDMDMANYGYYVDSGSNPVNAMTELLIFHRKISREEIFSLYYSMGSTPSYDYLTGYYQMVTLDCEANVLANYGTSAATVESGTAPSLVSDGSVNLFVPAANSRVRFYSPAPFSLTGAMTVSFWYQEEKDSTETVRLFRIEDRTKSSNPSMDISLEPGGNLVLTLGTNWSKIVHNLASDFDDTDGHMVTLRIQNR